MPHATRPGDLLGDRYRLVDLLTETSGGRFWRAYDQALERHVAVHVIRGDDERAPALMDAARRSATLLDRRVLRVLDADCTDDVCYVVNEWGWGTSLDIVVAGGATLGPRRAAWLVAEVADSVAAAHALGIAHGRLNPENVLVDRVGNVRLIGLCVDAALHGLDGRDGTDGVDAAPRARQRDVDDLAGLLYCALTGRWAGTSRSIVPAAPRGHGEVLRPRQVRAGIPRALDLLCDEVLHPDARTHELGDDDVTARDIADYLDEFVGDVTGMPASLLASVPDVLPEEEQVVLPPVPEMRPYPARREPDPEPDPEPEPQPVEQPTEAGVPIFGDDDVSWLERRTTPVPPPPPFEAPPERPLFAPEPDDGRPVRRPRRPDAAAHRGETTGEGTGDGFWPWESAVGLSTSSSTLDPVEVTDERAPGRGFLRLATVLALVLVLALGVVVAIQVRGGDGTDDPAPSPSGVGEPGRGSIAGVVGIAGE